jgi:hypothetical protein
MNLSLGDYRARRPTSCGSGAEIEALDFALIHPRVRPQPIERSPVDLALSGCSGQDSWIGQGAGSLRTFRPAHFPDGEEQLPMLARTQNRRLLQSDQDVQDIKRWQSSGNVLGAPGSCDNVPCGHAGLAAKVRLHVANRRLIDDIKIAGASSGLRPRK